MVSSMRFQGLFHSLPILIALASACNPYDYQKDEFNAGPVDAANFPKPYQGEGADPNVHGYLSGRGKFTEVRAFNNRLPAGYYLFPFTNTQLSASDPLLLPQDPRRQPQTPNAYVFDAEPPSPFPSSQKCNAPSNYTYEPRTDDMRLDEQGNIFTLLPLATERPGLASTFEYIPVVAEIAVSAAGLDCQSIKSEQRLNRILGNPSPTGNFLLWAIIDPSSGVYRVGQQSGPYLLPDGSPNPDFRTGLGVQKWGWFGHYYLAYIDGGYVPTQTTSTQALRMRTQPLYIPLRITPAGVRCGSATCQAGQVCANNICQSCNANRASPADSCPTGQRCCPSPQTCFNPDAGGTCADLGKVGQGYDVLQSRRSDANYSPVCEVRQYTANIGTPARPRQIGELPQSVADVLALSPTTQPPTIESGIPRYVYCPQVD